MGRDALSYKTYYLTSVAQPIILAPIFMKTRLQRLRRSAAGRAVAVRAEGVHWDRITG